MITNLKEIHFQSLTWIHAKKPTDSDLRYLQEKYQFHPLDIVDAKKVSLHPKLDEYPEYLFMILLFAYYDRQDRGVKAAEVDFFIGDKYLITIGDGHLEVLDAFFADCYRDKHLQKLYMSGATVSLLHEIIHRLQNATFPMLDHITLDIENIENQIFAGNERRMVREILIIKRNIVSFRRIMNSHKNLIKKLMTINNNFFEPGEMKIALNNALERSRDIWDILQTQMETITAFDETNESMISFKLNDIIKVLTTISVVLIPANLVVGIFGMNTTHDPINGQPYDFWIILTIVVCVIGGLLLWFKRKGWL